MTAHTADPQNHLTLLGRLHHARIWLNNHLAKRVGGCALCGADTRHSALSARICAACAQAIPHSLIAPERSHRCAQCAHLLPSGDPLCGDCLSAPPAFTHSVVFGDYAGTLQHALLQYKFHNALHLAPLLADCLQQALRAYAQTHQPDLIMLVPALPERTQARGFNPLRLLIQQIDLRTLWPNASPHYAPDALVRVHHDQLQVHVKPEQRRTQVKNAFALGETIALKDRHILLLDDIITTGATLNEIAQLLKNAGAKQVDNVLIARTPKAANK